jgi:hypothetical protein
VRLLAAGAVATTLLVSGCGDEAPSPAGGTQTAQECRRAWGDLAQLHGENGDPGSPVPALSRRWERYDEHAARLASHATVDDCGTEIDEFADAWGALESFEYDLADLDPADDLARAEADRRHYRDLHYPGEPPNQLSPPLRRAFRVIRRETPPAVADLEPALKGAADLDLSDPAARKAFLTRAHEIKSGSVHVRRMRHPYRVIGDAELDEE